MTSKELSGQIIRRCFSALDETSLIGLPRCLAQVRLDLAQAELETIQSYFAPREQFDQVRVADALAARERVILRLRSWADSHCEALEPEDEVETGSKY